MKVVNDALCRGCKNEEQTALHVFCSYEVYTAYHFEHIDQPLIEPWKIQDISIKCLQNFMSATGLFRD